MVRLMRSAYRTLLRISPTYTAKNVDVSKDLNKIDESNIAKYSLRLTLTSRGARKYQIA